MDEAIVSYHTPETKKQAKQWKEKGQPGPIKARVLISRTKQILLAFFDNKDLIYTNIKPRGSMVNTSYIKGPGHLHEPSDEEEAEDVVPEVFFHWESAPVHRIQMWMAANNTQLFKHLP
jgi:hypothetical protein